MSDFNLLKFSNKRKKINSSYNGNRALYDTIDYTRTGSNKCSIFDISSYHNAADIDQYFDLRTINPNSTTNDRIVKPVQLSQSLYTVNRVYANIIDYYANFFYIRYTVTPRQIKGKDKVSKEDYDSLYSKMSEVVEGISLETTVPTLLTTILRDGAAFVYADRDAASKTIQTILFPRKYCRIGNKTQYGTQEFLFDFVFFRDLALPADELEKAFTLFPEEFKEKYQLFLTDQKGYRWQVLDPRVATAITVNDIGFPTMLATFYDIINYRTYKENELEKNTNLLDRIVVQSIDLEKTGLDLEEVKELHDDIADIIEECAGSTLITTVGDVDVHQLQEATEHEINAMLAGLQTVYDSAGLNHATFTSETATGLQISLQRDEAYVWKFIEQIVNFYNLAVNNLYSFKNLQASIKLLPITHYNEKDKVLSYKDSASLGVGLVDYIVSTGIKQVDIDASLELDSYLDLHSRLVPLQSSYTQSPSAAEPNSKEESEEETTTKINSDEKRKKVMKDGEN